jgi:hypothetical protein
MKPFRKLSYANVVATLALFLALTGGVVWAAAKIHSNQIAKHAVKNKNLAKKAVKTNNLADNAVTSPKIADGAVGNSKLGAGSLVVATATANSIPATGATNPLVDVPLAGQNTFTPAAGQAATMMIEAKGTLAKSAASSCQVVLIPVSNGKIINAVSGVVALLAPDPSSTSIPEGIPLADASTPVGLDQPGVPQQLSLKIQRDPDCTPASQIDSVKVVVTEAK